MKRSLAALVVFAALALACGGGDDGRTRLLPGGGSGGAGGAGGNSGPFPPEFAGVESVTWEANVGSARVTWQPATDRDTPPEDLRYRILVWQSRPAEGVELWREVEVQRSEEECRPSCRHNLTLPARDVMWVAVEATDGEAAVGRDVVLPVVAADPADVPVIESVTPTSGAPGDEIVIRGQNFFDERVGLDGLTLDGEPIDPDGAGFVKEWSALRIRFVLHTGLSSGKIAVKTPLGTATSAEDFEVLP